MEPSAYQLIITGILTGMGTIAGTVFGAFISPWINWRFARKIAIYNSKFKAQLKFRRVVLDAYAGVYPEIDPQVKDITSYLVEHFSLVQSAIEEFRPFIASSQIGKFNKAWEKFKLNNHYSHVQIEEKYSNPKEAQEILCNNIEKLLSFTFQKEDDLWKIK